MIPDVLPAGVVVHESPVVVVRALLVEAFAAAGVDVPVASKVPDPVAGDAPAYPPVFVTLTRVGSDRVSPVHQEATVLVEVRGDDEGDVEDVAILAHALLLADLSDWAAGAWVHAIYERSGVVSTGDFERQLERYQFQVVVRTRGRYTPPQ